MTRRKTTRSSSSSSNEGEAFERIPFDLIVEIHLRLPVKSVARFRCVSKLWYSTFLGSNFTDSFFTISSSRPKLLFTCLKDGETFFFTSPQPQDSSSPLSADIHMTFPVNCPTNISRPVRGLVCGLNQRTSKGRTVTVPLICNPSTGQSLALPRVETRRRGVISYFGYDPIDKSFKVLCMTVSNIELNGSKEHQVLTLGTGKELSWMMIKCDVTHDPAVVEVRNGFSLYDGICINGVVYYLAYLHASYDESPDIVSFDIKSEKFNYIKKADGGMIMDWRGNLESTLVNYKDKLAKLEPNIVNGIYNGIQLWVLENAEKHKWSSYIYLLPPLWKNIFEETKLCFVGTTGKGEIVLSPNTISGSFYLIYYNPERDTITKVGIQGMEAFKGHKAYTFLDHAENATLFSQGLSIMGS